MSENYKFTNRRDTSEISYDTTSLFLIEEVLKVQK